VVYNYRPAGNIYIREIRREKNKYIYMYQQKRDKKGGE